ncbi:hypothetical protein B0H63DRAFT_479959 [Podospora didyma]|uniref:Uncharacterized protein n=1 Tax=Podospora didyma TaxID=330526 RepID=A0AAE0KLJ5_9PEZI|nr:hypothetical protein B0H63DRAFT_479959 [Podospora didyma]
MEELGRSMFKCIDQIVGQGLIWFNQHACIKKREKESKLSTMMHTMYLIPFIPRKTGHRSKYFGPNCAYGNKTCRYLPTYLLLILRQKGLEYAPLKSKTYHISDISQPTTEAAQTAAKTSQVTMPACHPSGGPIRAWYIYTCTSTPNLHLALTGQVCWEWTERFRSTNVIDSGTQQVPSRKAKTWKAKIRRKPRKKNRKAKEIKHDLINTTAEREGE